jgi:hypothetical protein
VTNYWQLTSILFLSILLSSSILFAQINDSCVPNCRSGFICHERQCISKCNPICTPNEKCTDNGMCVIKKRNGVAQNVTSQAASKSSEKSELSFYTMLGVVTESNVYIGGDVDTNIDTETGFIFRSGIERSSKIFRVGLYLNYIKIDTEGGGEATIITPGLTLKVPIELSSTVELRVGIGFGYQMSTAKVTSSNNDSTLEIDDIIGFDVAPISELAIKTDDDLTILLSISGFSQPTGGNDDFSIEWAPIIFIAGGLEFGY